MLDDVLSFWFADGFRPREAWFRKSDAFDAEVLTRFGPIIDQATRGELDSWESTPRGRLALVVLLDQMSRNAHRGSARAFAQDALAIAAARRTVDAGQDASLAPLERSFLYMPFMHAEDRAAQARSVALFDSLAAASPPDLADYLTGAARYARAHQAIIERFGRFPHRNENLGRPSTPEEIAFMKQPGSAF